jgi:predicted phage-related endonuclease
MEPVVMIDGEYSASLDGLSLDGSLILEVKCPFHGCESSTWLAVKEGRIEPHYQVQIQHQLMVAEAERADFFVFAGRDGIVVSVQPDLDMRQRIREAWDAFWPFVVSDTPPPLSPLDTVIRQDEAWRVAAEAFIASKAAADRAAKKAETAKQQLASLALHTSERGFGVAVSRFWRGRKATQEEVRVTVLKSEEEPC